MAIIILTDLEEGATYRVRVSARTVNGTGPYTKWDSIDIPVRTKADRKSRMTPGKGKIHHPLTIHLRPIGRLSDQEGNIIQWHLHHEPILIDNEKQSH